MKRKPTRKDKRRIDKTVLRLPDLEVAGRSTTPGGHVTAVASGNRFTLFMADVNGEIFTTSGTPYATKWAGIV
jgi:hypothetical protein